MHTHMPLRCRPGMRLCHATSGEANFGRSYRSPTPPFMRWSYATTFPAEFSSRHASLFGASLRQKRGLSSGDGTASLEKSRFRACRPPASAGRARHIALEMIERTSQKRSSCRPSERRSRFWRFGLGLELMRLAFRLAPTRRCSNLPRPSNFNSASSSRSTSSFRQKIMFRRTIGSGNPGIPLRRARHSVTRLTHRSSATTF
jgi:hypothetical protein